MTPDFKCETRTQLFAGYTDAINRAIEMQRQYIAKANSGRGNTWQIEEEVVRANEDRKVARDAYLKHIREHGCGTEA